MNSIIRPSVPKTVLLILHCSTDNQALTENFNDRYCAVGKNLIAGMRDTEYLPVPQRHEVCFAFSNKTSVKVISTAKLFYYGKSTGIDTIPVSVLKNNINALAATSTSLFNKAFFTSVYPDAFKMARVFSICKTGHPNDHVNYRPISALSCINPLFEKLSQASMTVP